MPLHRRAVTCLVWQYWLTSVVGTAGVLQATTEEQLFGSFGSTKTTSIALVRRRRLARRNSGSALADGQTEVTAAAAVFFHTLHWPFTWN